MTALLVPFNADLVNSPHQQRSPRTGSGGQNRFPGSPAPLLVGTADDRRIMATDLFSRASPGGIRPLGLRRLRWRRPRRPSRQLILRAREQLLVEVRGHQRHATTLSDQGLVNGGHISAVQFGHPSPDFGGQGGAGEGGDTKVLLRTSASSPAKDALDSGLVGQSGVYPCLTSLVTVESSAPRKPAQLSDPTLESDFSNLAGWTGLEDGAGDELERAYPSPASAIGHLRVVGGGADEPRGAEARSECNSVTRAAEARAERVRQMLEGALRAWLDTPSAGLRRRLLRLLLELDDLPE